MSRFGWRTTRSPVFQKIFVRSDSDRFTQIQVSDFRIQISGFRLQASVIDDDKLFGVDALVSLIPRGREQILGDGLVCKVHAACKRPAAANTRRQALNDGDFVVRVRKQHDEKICCVCHKTNGKLAQVCQVLPSCFAKGGIQQEICDVHNVHNNPADLILAGMPPRSPKIAQESPRWPKTEGTPT